MEKRRGALLGLIVVVLVGLSGVAHADKPTERKAVENFAAGRYDDALELFAKLYAETLNPVYLRNIGRCQQKLRHPDKAIDAFKDYLAKGKKISADERAEINGYIKEMEALRDEQGKQSQTPPPPANPPPAATPPPPVQPLPPAGGETSGTYPPGSYPPGTYPPGSYPPGTYPPGTYPPGPYPGTAAPASGPPAAGTLVAQPGPPPQSEASPVYKRWWFWTIVGAVVVGGVVTALVLTSGTDRPDCSAPGVTGLVCR